MSTITIFNAKGGQGKTSIALNLSLSLDMHIITNDRYTWLDLALSENNFTVVDVGEDFPDIKNKNIIYDFGGWLDNRATNIIKESNLVIIPMIDNLTNNLASFNSLKEALNLNPNVIVIVNAVVKDNFDNISRLINEVFPNEKITLFPIKKTTAFEKIILYKKSVKDITIEKKVLLRPYKTVIEQFDNIINFIKRV